jgi:SpoVK/Ycf46/Vps4 family AAA+-type ATPase
MTDNAPGQTAAARHDKLEKLFRIFRLPRTEFDLWDKTYVDGDAKRRIFNAIAMMPITRAVRRQVGGRREIIILHGPPGTGKSRLARAGANGFAQWVPRPDADGVLLLQASVSKWVSGLLGDSQKTVEDAFESVRLLLNFQPVVLVIDEIESIATNRSNLSAGDPTDVHRFVNALLTGIDALDGRCDMLLIATSNQEGMIDPAFLDRASHKIRIGYSGRNAARAILRDQARAYRTAGIEISDTVINALVEELYCDAHAQPQLSGRDLSDLLHLAMTQYSTLRPGVAQLVSIAREQLRRNSNGQT